MRYQFLTGRICPLPESTSVIKHFSFFGFLNPENPGKQQKTWKQRDLGTYVPFGENLTDLDTTKTYETYGSSSSVTDYCGYKFITPINYS